MVLRWLRLRTSGCIVERMAARTSTRALGGLVGILVVGCGNDAERASTTEAPATKPTQTDNATTPPGLNRFLLRADEGPGLEPLSPPQTDTGEPFDLPKEGGERLRRSGYISTTYQTGQGDASAGVSSVLLFETEAGARDWRPTKQATRRSCIRSPTARSTRSGSPTSLAHAGGRDPTCMAMPSAMSTGPKGAA